ncbi:MAG TPA: hypothetical protein VK919_11700 [Solirubrobacterales bacterium]|nr:hypothetical protein [Solirubrobacterales bacterium]
MDLELIGPRRREQTRVGDHPRARLLLTLADLAGLVAGTALAVALLLVLVL